MALVFEVLYATQPGAFDDRVEFFDVVLEGYPDGISFGVSSFPSLFRDSGSAAL